MQSLSEWEWVFMCSPHAFMQTFICKSISTDRAGQTVPIYCGKLREWETSWRGERARRRRTTQRGSGKLGATIYINITSVGSSSRLIMT